MTPYDLHLARVSARVLRGQTRGPISFGQPGPSPLAMLGADRAAEELSQMPEISGMRTGSTAELRGVDLAQTQDQLARGMSVEPRALVAYESIVLSKQTPVFRVRDNKLDLSDAVPEALPPAVRAALSDPAKVAALGSVFSAVARLDLSGTDAPYAGTAFVVGPQHLLTNRHVARQFSWGERRNITIGAAFRPHAAFGHERSAEEAAPGQDAAGLTLPVLDVAWIHPYWDAALLRVGGELPGGANPLVLAAEAPDPDALVGRAIAVIGFPSFSPSPDPSYEDLQRVLFRGVFEVKRFQPGLVTGLGDARFGTRWEQLSRRVLKHNSSTLGGNSGSALVDLESGVVLGLHFWGDPNADNLAVPAWELARDPVVRATSVSFSQPADPAAPEPPWTDQWRAPNAGQTPTGESPGAASASRRAAIVLLPGILGSNLIDMDSGRKIWLDAGGVVFGRIDRDLALGRNGSHSASGARLAPAGPLGLAYDLAIASWRAQGHPVIPFAFDWRRSFESLAQGLGSFLRRTVAIHGPVVLACHSMGGLVAAVWATRNAADRNDWATLVSKVVMVGTPAGGSFAPMEAFIGTFPLLRAMAAASTQVGPLELRRMAASFPGLVAMLPDPDLFPVRAPDRPVDELLVRETWRQPGVPTERSLAGTRALRAAVARSPLFERSTAVLADAWPTISGWRPALLGGPAAGWHEHGDTLVPARSAAFRAAEENVYVANGFRHPFMLNNPAIIEAIGQLARGETITAVSPWSRPSDLSYTGLFGIPRFSDDPTQQVGAALRETALAGLDDPEILVRLMDPLAPEGTNGRRS